MRTARLALSLAGLVLLVGLAWVVHQLNDFARVQNAEVGSTPFERGKISKVVVTNNTAKNIAFRLRCDHKVRPRGELLSRNMLLQPRTFAEIDVNPELAGEPLPAMIADKSCEATWYGPLGTTCRAWTLRWTYAKPTRKGIVMADEDGACRIATCYSTSKLTKIPSCLYAVYVARPLHERRT